MGILYKNSRSFHLPGKLVLMMLCGLVIFVALVALPVCAYFMVTEPDRERGRWFAIGALAALVMGVTARLVIFGQSGRLRCPLCQGQIFRGQRCRKSEKARHYFLTSYNGSMLIDLWLRGKFICKYCGTPYGLWKSFRKQRERARG